MNPSQNVKRIAHKLMLPTEDNKNDGDNDNRPKEKKLKRIQLNMKIRSISRTHDKWNSQSAYDKICKELGLIRKFIVLFLSIFKTNMTDSSCDAKAIMGFSSLIRDKRKEDDDFIQGMSPFLIFVSFLLSFLGCSTELNVTYSKDTAELLQGQHENLNMISIKAVLATINQAIHVLEIMSASVKSVYQFLFTMAHDRRPPVKKVKEMKVYVSEEDTNDDQSFGAAICSSKVSDEKSGEVESDFSFGC